MNENNLYEVSKDITDKIDMQSAIDFGGEQFQLIAIDSLLLHKSIRSKSKSSTRLTYIWRVSSINSINRVRFGESY